MLGDILDFMDDITGNVVSDSIKSAEIKSIAKQQYVLYNSPSETLAREKIRLFNQIAQYDRDLVKYKDCEALVELNTKWKIEAVQKLELLK